MVFEMNETVANSYGGTKTSGRSSSRRCKFVAITPSLDSHLRCILTLKLTSNTDTSTQPSTQTESRCFALLLAQGSHSLKREEREYCSVGLYVSVMVPSMQSKDDDKSTSVLIPSPPLQ